MTPRDVLAELRGRDSVLFGTGLVMLILLLASAVAMLIDDRQILGINRWIKPAKFESSILIFLWTLAWFMPEVRGSARTRAIIRWTAVVAMLVEIVLIAGQSARGRTSHFNNATPLDGAIFSIMGIMITLNTIAMIILLFAMRRDTPPDRAGYLWGIRIGVAIFVLASSEGFVIVANQAHTVAAPDGGPGLPFVNWSTTAGDLRIAHFFGMHALQVLPLAGFLLDRSATLAPTTRRNVIAIAGIGWMVVMGGLLAIALSGRPLIAL